MRIDPRKQFSKRLARWTSIFWFVFMTWLSVLFLLVPASALYCVYMGIIATAVMIINVYSYCKNSIAEKMIFGLIDKTRIEIGLVNGKTGMPSTTDTEDAEAEDTDEEGSEDEDG